MLFGGYAIISFFLKDLQMSRVRQMISLGFAFSMSGFAFMGTIEYIRGFAGAGIFSAVIGELFLALLYLSTWFSDRKNGITEGIES